MKLKNALSTHLSTTSLIHERAYGFTPKPLKRLLETVDYNFMEAGRIRERTYQTPYKYYHLTVIDSLIEKLSEPIARRSLAIQLYKMSNPTFASDFMNDALKHIYRKKY